MTVKRPQYYTDKMVAEINRFCQFRDIPCTELSRMAFGKPQKLKDYMSCKHPQFKLDDAARLMMVMCLRPDRFFGWTDGDDLTVDQIVAICKKRKIMTRVANALCRELRKENATE